MILGQIFRFGLVGVCGFATDAIVLFCLVSANVNAFASRIFSFSAAVVVTWALNSAWTFASQNMQSRTKAQFLTYIATQCTGMAVNYAIYSVVLWQIGVSPLKSLLALAAGSAIGMIVNFIGARAVLHRR